LNLKYLFVKFWSFINSAYIKPNQKGTNELPKAFENIALKLFKQLKKLRCSLLDSSAETAHTCASDAAKLLGIPEKLYVFGVLLAQRNC